MQKSVKWTPAQAQKKPDNIISSKAREIGNIGFKPSYLSEPTENMKFIMSNEYMRIWFKEKARFEKETYSREQIIKEESKIKRRFVQRMMTYKKPARNDFLDEKFNRSVGNKELPIDYTKLKFKPVCPKEHGHGKNIYIDEKKTTKLTEKSSKIESSQNKLKEKVAKIESSKDVKDNTDYCIPLGAPVCVIPCCPSAEHGKTHKLQKKISQVESNLHKDDKA